MVGQQISLPGQEGWLRHKENAPFLSGADGVVDQAPLKLSAELAQNILQVLIDDAIFKSHDIRFASRSIANSSKCGAPSSSIANLHSGQKKSTMYGPMLICRRNFLPASFRF
jgi:hypothetical protein